MSISPSSIFARLQKLEGFALEDDGNDSAAEGGASMVTVSLGADDGLRLLEALAAVAFADSRMLIFSACSLASKSLR